MQVTKNKKVWVGIVVSFIVLGLVLSSAEQTAESVDVSQNDTIELLEQDVLRIAHETFQSKVYFTGETRPVIEGIVSAPIPGIIRRVYVKTGDKVEKNQPLIEFVDTRHKADYIDKKSQLASGQVLLKEKQEKLKHLENLYQKQSTSKETVRLATFDVEHQEQLVKSLDAQTHLAKRMFDQTTLYAPIAGAIAWRNVEVGQAIAEGKELLKIIEVKHLEVIADIHAGEIHKIEKDQQVEIYPPGLVGQVEVGKVERISPAAKEISRVHPVYIRINNVSKYLQSGMFIKGAIITDEKVGVLAIHKKWIDFSKPTEPYVYIANQQQVAKKQLELEQAKHSNDVFIVTQGLSEGDIVLNPKLPQITEAATITILEE